MFETCFILWLMEGDRDTGTGKGVLVQDQEAEEDCLPLCMKRADV